MAYTYGGGDRPAAFREKLQGNDPGPDAIQCWDQYADGRKPGGKGEDYPHKTHHFTGTDCSEFVRTVLGDVRLWDDYVRETRSASQSERMLHLTTKLFIEWYNQSVT